jgi:transposase
METLMETEQTRMVAQDTFIHADPRKKARRWPVERTHSWINRFRRLLIRWEKLTDNFLAMLHFAFALICVQRAAWGQSG